MREVFLQAVELPPAKRADFLAGIGREEPAVQREVASLLEHHRPETVLAPTPASARSAGARPAGHGEPRQAVEQSAPPKIARAPRTGRRARISKRVALTALVLLAVAVFVVLPYRTVRAELRAGLEQDLETVVESSRKALEHWIRGEQNELQRWASSPGLASDALALSELAAAQAGAEVSPAGLALRLKAAPEFQRLSQTLKPLEDSDVDYGWAVVDRTGRILVAPDAYGIVGRFATEDARSVLDRVFRGETVFVPPFRSGTEFDDPNGDATGGIGLPVVALLAPIVEPAQAGEESRVLAALVRRQHPTGALKDILEVARRGTSGETYAVSASGQLLSDSRFSEELASAGADAEGVSGRALDQLLVDPGGNLLAGFEPSSPPSAWPLTLSAQALTEGLDGANVHGYRDYRGVDVAGAWRWLDSYGFGITTQLDLDEALGPLAALENSFLLLIGLLALLGVVLLLSSYSIQQLSESVDEARALGQYTLEELIGEGGSGEVWLARHAMLRRPCAVKVIKRHKATEQAVKRFEREVQLTSLLTNPNTIAIYDYGRTPDGRFYYAMEYLQGLTLARLVQLEGHVPAARVAGIMRKVASSLREAHAAGIVHRDVKPLNIMLCRRGGEPDVVKVLDFGLVKDIETTDGTALTAPDIVAGTPQYLAPERLNTPDDVDGRADLYALGCVAYNLLTGKDVFRGRSSMAICAQVLNAPTPRAAENAEQVVPAVLDDLVFELMSKSRDHRPQDAEELIENLDAIELIGGWTEVVANDWWDRYEALQATPLSAPPASDSSAPSD